MLRYKTIIAGISVLLLAGAVGLQLGQMLGAFSVSGSSPAPVQIAGNSGAAPQTTSIYLGVASNGKSSINKIAELKPGISSLPSKKDRMKVASLGAGLGDGFFDSKSGADTGLTSQASPDRSVVADDAMVFEKQAPVRMEQSLVTALLSQGRTRKEKRRKVAFNRSEKMCLARAIYFEARSESRAGQIAVANVIMNRKVNRYYPNTVCRVVNQGDKRRTGCQFSFRCDGQPDIPREKKSWRNSLGLADLVLEGKLRDSRLRGVTHYHADYVSPKWAKQFRRVAKIGKHIFYIAPKIAFYGSW